MRFLPCRIQLLLPELHRLIDQHALCFMSYSSWRDLRPLMMMRAQTRGALSLCRVMQFWHCHLCSVGEFPFINWS